jgi:hypothetical protein
VLNVPIQFLRVTADQTFLSNTSNGDALLSPQIQLSTHSTARNPTALKASTLLGIFLFVGEINPTFISWISTRATASPFFFSFSEISLARFENASLTVWDETWFSWRPGGEMSPVEGTMMTIFLAIAEEANLFFLAREAVKVDRSEAGM